MARAVRDIVPMLRRAFQVASSGVPGPVFVELPIDVLYVACSSGLLGTPLRFCLCTGISAKLLMISKIIRYPIMETKAGMGLLDRARKKEITGDKSKIKRVLKPVRWARTAPCLLHFRMIQHPLQTVGA